MMKNWQAIFLAGLLMTGIGLLSGCNQGGGGTGQSQVREDTGGVDPALGDRYYQEDRQPGTSGMGNTGGTYGGTGDPVGTATDYERDNQATDQAQ